MADLSNDTAGKLLTVAKSIGSQREACYYSRRLINNDDDTPPIRIIGSTRSAECFAERLVCHSYFIFIYIIAYLATDFGITD